MRLLKVLLLLSFLFCFIAAGHGGGPFGMLEVGLLMNLGANDVMENAILMITIIAQILGSYSLWDRPDEPDALSMISNSVCVIFALAAIFISKDAIALVLSFNSIFLITAAIYFTKSIQYKRQQVL